MLCAILETFKSKHSLLLLDLTLLQVTDHTHTRFLSLTSHSTTANKTMATRTLTVLLLGLVCFMTLASAFTIGRLQPYHAIPFYAHDLK